ncbi:death-on-curing family protein [uncultured Eubacterium sp.]|nr:death-on-curing family protein [uncultured Eubacterium sp.]
MIFLNTEEIVELHHRLIEKTGGLNGIRDHGLLESAIHGVFASFDGVERYPSLEEKAARYAYALTANHAFVDGNKRIGVFVMLVTLSVNGIDLIYTQEELIRLGLALADGSFGYEDVLSWITLHEK